MIDDDYGPAPKKRQEFMISFDVLKLIKFIKKWRYRNAPRNKQNDPDREREIRDRNP